MAKIDKHGKGAPKHAHRAAKADDGPAKSKGKDKDHDEKKASPKPQAGSWRDGFGKADKNDDGKLKKSEMSLAKLDAKTYDADGNGQVTRREFHVGHRQANSFAGLDRDRDGALDQGEMRQASRFTKASYDTDGDGRVNREEFTASRKTENAARREDRLDTRFKALKPKDQQALTRYDADRDGKISRAEFGAGRDADVAKAREAKIAANFDAAGGRAGSIQAAGSTYASYDANRDGAVDKAEFHQGQMGDRARYWEAVHTVGKADGALAKRLDLNARGMGLNRIRLGGPTGPVGPGTAAPMPGGKGMTDVVISSFNILGSSHTTAGGNKPGYASGPERMKDAVALLKQHDVDIVGFQEMEGNQKKTFQRMAGDDYAIYSGSKGGKPDPANSIAWRR
ncbi:MAG: hypothetical protein ACK46X_12020, partial [Candidatus Sericytochromatia bacterium]